MDMRKLVGRNFARLRAAANLTQEQVAERADISQQYISGLERGQRNPSVETLARISEALGISHIELLLPDGRDNGQAEASDTP